MCEYALSVSEGVPMTVRKKLLSEWVQCKRLLHQPIASGTYDISEVSSSLQPSPPSVRELARFM